MSLIKPMLGAASVEASLRRPHPRKLQAPSAESLRQMNKSGSPNRRFFRLSSLARQEASKPRIRHNGFHGRADCGHSGHSLRRLFSKGEKDGRRSISSRRRTIAAVANYREIVLAAFQQVEDQVAALRILEQEAQKQDHAVK